MENCSVSTWHGAATARDSCTLSQAWSLLLRRLESGLRSVGGPWPSTFLTETVQKVLEDSSGVCQGTGDEVALAVAAACVAKVESHQQLCKGSGPMGPSGCFRVRSSLPLCHSQVLGAMMQMIRVLGGADDLGLRDGYVSLAGGESALHQFGAVTPVGLWLGSVNCLKGLPVFKSPLPPIQCE